jgi:hypothetical protein
MERQIVFHGPPAAPIAEVVSEECLIRSAQEALNLMMEISYQGADRMILHEHQLAPEFFDLKTGLAGDVLQKFSNYRMTLSVVGDFTKFESNSLRDFISESNRAGRVTFVATLDEAILKLP